MHDIEKLLDFILFTNKVQKVVRSLYVTGEDRLENDAEHSFQVALVAWYIANSNNLNLDIGKILKYSLVHDLVEVYAGDTFAHTKDKALKESKAAREKAALDKIISEFPEFSDIYSLIDDYENRIDDESKLVYAVDKVMPPMNIYNDKGRSWRKHKVTLDMIKNEKKEKVKVSKDIESYWNKFLEKLEVNPDLFNS